MEIDIKNYIEAKVPELQDRLFPVFTTDINSPSVVYDFKPITRGYLNQSQLQLRIIWNDYDECKALEEKLNDKKCLAFEEDAPFIVFGKTRFYSILSGGGVLFNEKVQMYEDTLIYILKWRNTNG
jgi:hypothetical protein